MYIMYFPIRINYMSLILRNELLLLVFYFSVRRRHTFCALVTVFQTYAHPILHHRGDNVQPEHQRGGDRHEDDTAADHDVRIVHGLGSTVPTRDYLTVAVMAAMAARGGHGQSPCRRSALRAAGRGRRRDAD